MRPDAVRARSELQSQLPENADYVCIEAIREPLLMLPETRIGEEDSQFDQSTCVAGPLDAFSAR